MLSFLRKVLKKTPADTLPFVRFCTIGLANVSIHFLGLTAIVTTLSLAEGSPRAVANAVSFLAANLFSYQANSRWNFKVKTSFKHYSGFLATSLVGVCLSFLIMYFGQDFVARFDAEVRALRDYAIREMMSRDFIAGIANAVVHRAHSFGISFRMSASAWHTTAVFIGQVPLMAFVNFSLLRFFVFPRKKKTVSEPAK
ncbi:MAG: GtrA family protein [Puniceicoccales bacterium]|jgi:putative flippase GtrA|nr:GtrA family protein [Puniceicoccales bacterium]